MIALLFTQVHLSHCNCLSEVKLVGEEQLRTTLPKLYVLLLRLVKTPERVLECVNFGMMADLGGSAY